MSWIEPGRSVAENGRISYAWPPQGRFIGLWERLCAAIPDESERLELLSLLRLWQSEESTLVGFTGDNGEWVDVEIPDYPPEP